MESGIREWSQESGVDTGKVGGWSINSSALFVFFKQCPCHDVWAGIISALQEVAIKVLAKLKKLLKMLNKPCPFAGVSLVLGVKLYKFLKASEEQVSALELVLRAPSPVLPLPGCTPSCLWLSISTSQGIPCQWCHRLVLVLPDFPGVPGWGHSLHSWAHCVCLASRPPRQSLL